MFLTPDEIDAVRLSFLVSLASATAGLVPAIALGHWLARSRARWKWIVEAIASLPLVLPPVVTGYLLLLLLAPAGPVGKLFQALGCKIVFTPYAAVIAALVVSFPLAFRTIRLSFEAVDVNLERTARTLGAAPMAVFWEVSLPLASRGVIGGWLLAFARSLGEFGATIMVAGNIAGSTRTIPLAIYARATQPSGLEQSWRLVVISIIISCLAIAVGEFIVRKRGPHAA